ncbi:MAG TPA: phenylalanine--tRNA ligase subunit beta [Candidatus Baltobacteraceae bacterium]|nr:phenylalanine--tRNA ligase subunit beta [Candidatus Baltobacteraceae bacterium]
MRVPIAWLRDYVDLPSSPQRIAEMLAQIGFPVEAIEQRAQITGVVTGRIAKLEKHPNADRLQVGTIDVGNGALLTIATAATNVAQGQTIGVATIGAQLPNLRIERRKMRGVESEGMMISAEELALPAEWFEDGIMQLDGTLPLGADLVEAFRLSDAVLEVEITSNRVDAMSMIGLARELAAYQGVPLRLPSFEYESQPDPQPPRIDIQSPDCRRFVAQRFANVRVGTSPAWMRVRLALAGQRPINTIVDISNYVMLEVGQPLHFYDEDRIRGRIIVRDAEPGEPLKTLDDAERELTPQALVIADESGALGLAGLKGGESSEISAQTTSMLLEAANFEGARVRRVSAQLALRTEASSRHEKALPPALADLGAARSAHLLTAQGARAYAPIAAGQPVPEPPRIRLRTGDVPRLLGFDLPPQEIRELLDRLGFAAQAEGAEALIVTPPPWRRDVTLSADVVEEIARMAGYDRIESVIPAVAPHEIASTAYDLETRVAQTCAALGYREIASYALQGAHVFEKLRRAGVDPGVTPVEVLNPLSEDQRYLRFALWPAMLQYLSRVGEPLKVFELGHTFADVNGQPEEHAKLAFAFTAQTLDEPAWRDSHFLALKGDAYALVRALTGRSDVETAPDERPGLHPGKTGIVLLDGREIVSFGCLDPRVAHAFDLRLPAYVATVYLDNIPDYRVPQFKVPSKYPSTYRDLAVVCEPDVPAAKVQETIARAIGALCTQVRAFDEYRGPQIAPGKKSLAIRVTMQRFDRTITDEEADAAIAAAVTALQTELGAALRA